MMFGASPAERGKPVTCRQRTRSRRSPSSPAAGCQTTRSSRWCVTRRPLRARTRSARRRSRPRTRPRRCCTPRRSRWPSTRWVACAAHGDILMFPLRSWSVRWFERQLRQVCKQVDSADDAAQDFGNAHAADRCSRQSTKSRSMHRTRCRRMWRMRSAAPSPARVRSPSPARIQRPSEQRCLDMWIHLCPAACGLAQPCGHHHRHLGKGLMACVSRCSR
jgi:hypothetical protein